MLSFSNNKVEKIRNDLAKGSDINSANVGTIHSTFNANVVPFETFKPVSTKDIVKIARNPSSKSCVLDTLPKWLCKDNFDIMCHALKTVVNKSFSSNEFPSKLRKAKIASSQLQEHLQLHGLQEEYQSANRAQINTETALLRVKKRHFD